MSNLIQFPNQCIQHYQPKKITVLDVAIKVLETLLERGEYIPPAKVLEESEKQISKLYGGVLCQ